MPELSHDAKRDLIRGKLDPDNKYEIWVRDVYDDRVIVEDEGKLYEYPYTLNDKQEVTLGERKEVIATYEALGELKDVEVLKTGTFTSMSGTKVTYSAADLDEIVENAQKLEGLVRPPFVATHKEGDDATIQVFGSVTGGILHNIRKVGETLLADIKGVPNKGVELLREVKEMLTSPEVYNNFKDDEGNAYGKVLRRLSWVDIPAIKSKAGITEANLFEEATDQPTTWILFSEPDQSKQRKERNSMEIDIRKMSKGEILKLGEKQIATLSEADAGYVVLLQENDRLKSENESHVSRLSEHEATVKKTKVENIVARFQGKEGEEVLAPAALDSIRHFAEQLDSTAVVKFGEGDQAKEATLLDRFSDVLDSFISRSEKGTLVIRLGEVAPSETDKHGESEFDQVVDTIAGVSK